MKYARAVGAALILLCLVIGAPVLLVLAGRLPDLSREWSVLVTPDDGSLLAAVITLVGWVAWLVFTTSVIAEIVEVVTAGRRRFRPALLRLPRALAGVLVAAVVAVAVARIVAPAPPASMSVTYQPDAGHAAHTQQPTQQPTQNAVAPNPDSAPTSTPAQPAATTEAAAATAEYTVQPGDDLWSLAASLLGSGHRWSELAALNPTLDPRADLEPGQRLRVPAESESPPTSGAPASAESVPTDGHRSILPAGPRAPADAAFTPPDQPSEPRREQRTVTVKPGDSLWRIAARHLGSGERWPEIHRLNTDRISDPDEIEIGWVLRLPTTTADGVTDPPGSPPKPLPESAQTHLEPGPRFPHLEHVDALPLPPSERRDNSDPHSGERPASTPQSQAPRTLAGDSAIDPALLVLGGVGPVLAAGVCGVLAARRELQRWNRPPGRRVLHPTSATARVETALHAVAEPEQVDLTELALRTVGDHCQAFGLPLPALETVAVEPAGITLRFAEPPAHAPIGFTSTATGWYLPRTAALDPPRAEQPYPAVCTLGRAQDNSDLLLNLDGGTFGIVGPEPALTNVLRGLALELTSTPWANRLQVRATGEAGRLLRACASQTDEPTAAELVTELEAIVTTRQRELATSQQGVARLRTDPDRSDAWQPVVFVFAPGLAAEVRDRIDRALIEPAIGVTAVLAGAPGDRTLHLEGDPQQPTGVLEPIGVRLAAQYLPETTATAITQLHEAASSELTTPASWWDHTATNVTILTTPVTSKEPLVPASQGVLHPTLNLLGPIELVGTTGTPPPRGHRTCMEYCGWLLEHPGSTGAQMAASLMVAESSRRSSMSRLRTWLGRATEGDQYLPDAYSGRISLHPAVSSDWHQLQILVAPGINRVHPGTLRTALSLVRGAPLADAAPGQWHWAEELRSDMVATLRDIGVVLGDHALTTGDIDLARWAAVRALTACPEDEQLLCLRIRTEHRAGNQREVERLVLRLTGHARKLGTDLADETVLLLQQVMEGSIRARTVTS